MIILSILCSTTPDREGMFARLYSEVFRQTEDLHTVHPTLGRVEILVDDSKRFLDGGLSIGKKREALLKRATGKYVAYLDSDEDVAPNYIEAMVRLCQLGADVITFRNISKFDTYWTFVDMSLNYKVNDQASPNYITRRRPWHICPVKKEYAGLYNFDNSNYGEDWLWFEKVLTHCTTESHTNAVLHQYNHSSKHSEADKIINTGHK